MQKPGPVDTQLPQDVVWDIWSKGEIFAGNDPVLWRRDVCGAWIFRSHYQKIDSEYGWVIDRINPLSDDDVDTISNLRPVQWENTIHKDDGTVECRVTSTGIHNDKPIKKDALVEPVNTYLSNLQSN
ncbi:MAG TPA: hypothetical protein VFA69_08395 [Candidatus Nitrosotalea sp.]|nr:hypothetical protein [Candidatus Nitrosotalea sp.]